MNWLQKTALATREISNWFYIRKIVRKSKNDEVWKNYNLRTGYIGQIYTVVNLRDEDMGEEEMVQRMRVVEKIEPVGKYLDSLGLSEIIYPEIVDIPNTRSWLVIFWPLQQYFSMWRLVFWITGISLATYFITKYNVISTIVSWF
jgi:hypothetical protein